MSIWMELLEMWDTSWFIERWNYTYSIQVNNSENPALYFEASSSLIHRKCLQDDFFFRFLLPITEAQSLILADRIMKRNFIISILSEKLLKIIGQLSSQQSLTAFYFKIKKIQLNAPECVRSKALQVLTFIIIQFLTNKVKNSRWMVRHRFQTPTNRLPTPPCSTGARISVVIPPGSKTSCSFVDSSKKLIVFFRLCRFVVVSCKVFT